VPKSNQPDDLLSADVSKIGVPVQRNQTADSEAQRRRAKEDALLQKYEQKAKGSQSTEDFMADNFRDTLDEKRHDQSVYAIFFGLAMMVLAVVLYWVLGKYVGVERVPIIVAIMQMLGGRLIVPPVVGLLGALITVSGILGVISSSKSRKERDKTRKR
jgi:hypothetical protein